MSATGDTHVVGINNSLTRGPYGVQLHNNNTLLSHMLPSLHILRPLYLGYIRSAGQEGILAFEHLVLKGLVPMVVKAVESPKMAPHQQAASWVPIEPKCERDESFELPKGDVHVSLGAAWRMGLEEYSWYTRVDIIGTDTGFLSCYNCKHLQCIWDRTRHETPDYLFDGCYFNTVKFIDFENVSHIGDFFLARVPIQSIDLNPFGNVTRIGPYFLAHTSITSIDLSPLGGDRITCIPMGFLQGTALTSVDLTPFTGITSLASQTLHNCSKLETIVFGDALHSEHITTIPDDFLSGCTSLKDVPINNVFLPNTVTTIGARFMNGCAAIESIDLSPFGSVVSFGQGFMAGCKSLEHIDVSPILQHPSLVPSNFLDGCRSLKTLQTTTPFNHKRLISSIIQVDGWFMNDCVALEVADLEDIRGVTTIDSFFMANCKSLKYLDLDPISNVTTIGQASLCGCIALECINLQPLRHLTVIPASFMASCSSLVSLDLSPFTNITSVEINAFAACTGLTTEVDVSPWRNAHTIARNVLIDCGQGANWDVSSHVANLPPHVQPPPPSSNAKTCCIA